MKRILSIMIWILAASLMASAQNSFFYPHVVNGVLGSTTWRTTILLTNPASSGTATGALTFTQDNSDPLQSGASWRIPLTDETGVTTNSSVVTFTLAPGASHKYVSSTDPLGGFLSGFANVTTNSGTVSGTAIFSEFDSATNTLIGEAGVPSAGSVARQTIFVDTLGRYNIGVAYANPGTSIANITLTLVDNSGNTVGSPLTKTLGSGNHAQGFVSQFFPSAPQLVGSMQITSSTPLIAIALRFDPTLSKFTTLPAVTLASLLSRPLETLLEAFKFRIG